MTGGRLLFPSHDHYWFETLRVLGHTAYGGADVGEVLTAAADITAGDPNSWHQAWSAMAERIAATARHSQDTGHPVSAPGTAGYARPPTTASRTFTCTPTRTTRGSSTRTVRQPPASPPTPPSPSIP